MERPDQQTRRILKDGIKGRNKLRPLDEFTVVHRSHRAEGDVDAWLDQDGIVWYPISDEI